MPIGIDMKIRSIVLETHRQDVEKFIENAGTSLQSFRYFENRGIDSLEKHALTLLGYDGDNPVTYGHLDVDEEFQIWLGVCVAESYLGKGYGRKIVESLLNYATMNGYPCIYLSVDSSNEHAKELYKSLGFSWFKALKTTEIQLWKPENYCIW